MPTFREDHRTAAWVAVHPVSTEDQAGTAAMRALFGPNKGRMQGVQARSIMDALMEGVVAPAGVTYEADRIGGIPGWWCRPEAAQPGQAILHLHGGWFNWGSARAYRHLVGHIAASTKVAAFVPDYRLAPEHPFPAAVQDVQACYRGLAESGFSKIAITGDSAGGNLALGLLAHRAANDTERSETPVGAVLLSPVTDLAFSGESWSTRATADPYFTQPQVAGLIHSYLDGHDPSDPLASPLHADLKGLPPIRVHVGNDEMLLDDSFRLVERAAAAGVDARLDVWEGMAHGFLGSQGSLAASAETLQLVGAFLIDRFARAAHQDRKTGSTS